METLDIINNVVDGKTVVTKVKKIYKDGHLREVIYLNEQDRLYRDHNLPAYIAYYEGIDKVRLLKWYRDGEKYKSEGYRSNGTLEYETYYKNNEEHRDDDLPAHIMYYSNGKFPLCKVWCKEGLIHRDGDLPAYEQYHKSVCRIRARVWLKKGIAYRENNLPSKEVYNKDGSLHRQEWTSKEGSLYRDHDLPTVIEYHEDGKTKSLEEWHLNNKLHRLLFYGPARIIYDKSGNIIKEDYYFCGAIQKSPDSRSPACLPSRSPACLSSRSPACLPSRDALIEKIKTFSEEDIEKCLTILEIIKK